MITRTKTLSILGNPATEKPFLWRTGKVQQNAQDKGDGRWSIPNSGFTSQLKYKTVSGRFSGGLRGYNFTRSVTVDGWVTGASPHLKEQPHIWLRENETTDGERNVVSNSSGATAAIDGSATQWTAGTGCSIESYDPYVYSPTNTCIMLTRTSTTGMLSMTQANALVVGQRYKIVAHNERPSCTGVKTYKIGDDTGNQGTYVLFQNARPQRGSAQIDNGVMLGLGTFVASSTTLRIWTTDSTWAAGGDSLPVWGLDIRDAGSSPIEVWLCNEGDSVYFETLQELQAAAVAAINVVSSLTYDLDDSGDLILDSQNYCAAMMGPVPFVCGWGFYSSQAKRASALVDHRTGEIDTTPYLPEFAMDRATKGTSGPDGRVYNFENFSYYSGDIDDAKIYLDMANHHVLHIRPRAGSVPLFSLIEEDRPKNEQFVKNYSSCEYFWQASAAGKVSFSGRVMWPTSDAGTVVKYVGLSGLPAASGDKIDIQNGCSFYCDDSTDEGDGRYYMTVYSLDRFDNSTQTAGEVVYKKYCWYWCSGWMGREDEVSNGTDVTIEELKSDPHLLIDSSEINVDNPVDLLKQLLGDNTTDYGVPSAYQCTTISDIFGLSSSDRELIEWDKLRELVETSPVTGVKYSLKVPVSSATSESKSVDILSLLQAVCITHGISMIWGYQEAQRSWVLGFQRNDAETIAGAINSGSVIDSSNDVSTAPTIINGGSFSYSGISAAYKSDTLEGTNTFNSTDGTGRVQHSSGSTVLKVQDDLTLVPIGSAAQTSVRNMLQEQLLRLSNISHKLRSELKLSSSVLLNVGAQCVVDLPYLQNPNTGARGDGPQTARCESMMIDLGVTARVNAELTVSRLQLQGISPSMLITTWTRTDDTVSVTGLATDSAEFSDYEKTGLTDLATFGCWSYSKARGLYKRDDTCGAYQCYLFEADNPFLTTGASRNVWTCTIAQPTAANLAAGTASIEIVSSQSASFPESSDGKTYCLCFSEKDRANIAPCQIQLYGWYGDANGICTDSASAESKGIVIGA